MSSAPKRPRQRSTESATLSLSYKWLSVGLGVLLIVAIAALIVVSEREGASALTTVVLALALLSFVLQILFFIVGGVATSQQMNQSQELYGKTLATLATMSERADTTQRAVERLTERGLGAAIEKGIAQTIIERSTSIAEESTEALARQVTENVVPFLPVEPRDQVQEDEVEAYPRRIPEPNDHEVARLLQTFPDSEEEATSSIEQLSKLATPAQLSLRRFGSDEIRSRSGGVLARGFFFDRPELEAAGLIDADPEVEHAGRPLMRLTPRGRDVARLLTAPDPIPPSLGDTRLPQIRREVDELDRSLRAVRTAEDDD